jgi:hypothetical protein
MQSKDRLQTKSRKSKGPFSGRHKYNLILRNGTPSHNCGYNRRPIVIIGLASSTCVTNSGTARFPYELNNYKNKKHPMTD